jgi:hypothetical protein
VFALRRRVVWEAQQCTGECLAQAILRIVETVVQHSFDGIVLEHQRALGQLEWIAALAKALHARANSLRTGTMTLIYVLPPAVEVEGMRGAAGVLWTPQCGRVSMVYFHRHDRVVCLPQEVSLRRWFGRSRRTSTASR